MSKPAVAAKPKAPVADAASDAEATAAFNKPAKEKKPKEPAAPRVGPAPGGKTWVQWFKDTVAGGVSEKDAEAKYIELRSGEAAYAGEEGAKKLKRHAYHHRVLALDPPTKTK